MATVNASVVIKGSNIGTALQVLLMSDDIGLGTQPGYETCKTIYLYHPLGAKIVEKPLELAQSQKRKITVPDSPEQVVVDEFLKQWMRDGVDGHIFNLAKQARIYGISAIAMLERGMKNEEAVDYKKLYKSEISFNVYDPLNVAGSLVLNQDPMAMDFQHVRNIAVSGQGFHRTRACVMMNEQPIYLDYQSSAFGFTGRSVYQRALYPLKTFVRTMIADDMAARKVGLIVAKVKQGGSFIDGVMEAVTSFKRVVLGQGETNDVLSIGTDDDVASLNLQNLDGTLIAVRKDSLENIASAVPMPAKLLTQETMAEGFGEGTEDAKQIAQFVDRIREWLNKIYEWFDKIIRYRAWNPDFYKTIQRRFPEEYGDVSYEEAFYRWSNSFTVTWPSMLKEPDSELIKVDDVKLRAVVALLEVFLPILDTENKALAIEWACDAFNELKLLFGTPLNFDTDSLRDYLEENEEAAKEARENMGGGGDSGDDEDNDDAIPKPPKPGFRGDSSKSLIAFRSALDNLTKEPRKAGRR